MPWREIRPMELRMRLVNALVAEEDSMTALCEEYGVSRKTGYKWLVAMWLRVRAACRSGGQDRGECRVGDHPSAGRGDSRAAAAISELETEETARQVADTGAATALAGAEHHR
jgi:transposase-like protein